MGSIRLDGVLFIAYSDDHPPRHVHGEYGEAHVVVDLLDGGDVDLAKRRSAVRPRSAKQSDIRHVLNTAEKHFDILSRMWEEIHG